MLLVVGAALAGEVVLPSDDELELWKRRRRTTATVGAGVGLLGAAVVPMVVAWPEVPDPKDYEVDRDAWNDDPLEYRQRLERRSAMLHADRQAYVRSTWSRTTLSTTLAVAGIATLALAPTWSIRVGEQDATVGPAGVEVTF